MSDSSCAVCMGPLPPKRPTGPRATYCSDACRCSTHTRAPYKPGPTTKSARACSTCGTGFIGRKDAQSCSAKCGNARRDQANGCCSVDDCDRGVRAKGLCNLHWRRLARSEGREMAPTWTDARRDASHRRRAIKVGSEAERIVHADVYERDGWTCGLCQEAVEPGRVYPDPLSPSLDHILPLSKGGAHVMANVQLAHLSCNVQKGARVAA